MVVGGLVGHYISEALKSSFEASALPEEFMLEDFKLNVDQKDRNILIIIGEGGPSGSMFVKAAETYQRENGGDIYEVHNGDEFVAAMRDFYDKKGQIDHLEFFGHGNNVGLYVNQEPNVNGALYANDVDQNRDYVAASIYELEPEVFNERGWIKFNGCNVAEGFPEEDTLAQRVANYFDIDVVAPKGPTEFSRTPGVVDPIPNSNFLDPNFDGEVYMVPTYGDGGFVVVNPQELSESGFKDVRVGSSYEPGISGLKELGLEFEGDYFWPYKNITYAEAVDFCELFAQEFGEKECVVEGYGPEEKIRNLHALKMLVDAYGAELKYTDPWYDSYVWWASQRELLTKDFVNKKWYTRSEMAELVWNFIVEIR